MYRGVSTVELRALSELTHCGPHFATGELRPREHLKALAGVRQNRSS